MLFVALRLLAILVMVILPFAGTAWAQVQYGSIVGNVTGAVVAHEMPSGVWDLEQNPGHELLGVDLPAPSCLRGVSCPPLRA